MPELSAAKSSTRLTRSAVTQQGGTRLVRIAFKKSSQKIQRIRELCFT